MSAMSMNRRTLILGSAATGASALALSACGGSEGSGGSDAGGAGSDDARIRSNGREPENKLVPTNTSELAGGDVLNACFACLVYYTEDGSVENDVAESIESEDQQNWTIRLREGLTFSDGSPVTASSFVDAWNYGALTTNAQRAQSFFEPIQGFSEVAADTPTAQTLSGLAVVDDTTFTVALTSPQSDFPTRLGYWSYAPLPASAYDDMDAFGEKPIGNGPYTVTAWEHDNRIVLEPNPRYDGPRTAKNKGLEFVVYTDDDTVYNDLLSDQLDIVGSVPASHLADFQEQLGDRSVNQPAATLVYLLIPQYAAGFSGEAGRLRRQALSRAVDRAAICQNLFAGTRVPATDFVPPAVEGGGATDIPGAEVLTADAALAKDLWAQAEAIEAFPGTLEFAYPADGANKDWVEAVCNAVKNAIGVDMAPKPYPTFGEYKQQIAQQAITSPLRSNWYADYPSPFNFLFPLFATASADGKGSNEGNYKNPEVDALLAEAQSAPDAAAALEKYKAVQAVLMRDLPSIPLWYQNTVGGFSTAVKDVKFAWNGACLYHRVTKDA